MPETVKEDISKHISSRTPIRTTDINPALSGYILLAQGGYGTYGEECIEASDWTTDEVALYLDWIWENMPKGLIFPIKPINIFSSSTFQRTRIIHDVATLIHYPGWVRIDGGRKDSKTPPKTTVKDLLKTSKLALLHEAAKAKKIDKSIRLMALKTLYGNGSGLSLSIIGKNDPIGPFNGSFCITNMVTCPVAYRVENDDNALSNNVGWKYDQFSIKDVTGKEINISHTEKTSLNYDVVSGFCRKDKGPFFIPVEKVITGVRNINLCLYNSNDFEDAVKAVVESGFFKRKS